MCVETSKPPHKADNDSSSLDFFFICLAFILPSLVEKIMKHQQFSVTNVLTLNLIMNFKSVLDQGGPLHFLF